MCYFFFSIISIDVILRNEFIQGCLRDEFLRKILAPNTALLTGGGGQTSNSITTANVPITTTTTTTFNETGAVV